MTTSDKRKKVSEAESLLLAGGVDPSGGAGLAADLAAAHEFGVVGCPVVTALTVQDSCRCHKVLPVDPQTVKEQLQAVNEDLRPNVIKIGLTGSDANAKVLADFLDDAGILAVFDPVIEPSRGEPFLNDASVDYLKTGLVPKTFLLTPNRGEASKLGGLTIDSLTDASKAAGRLLSLGANYVLVKGIPSGTGIINDLLVGKGVEKVFSAKLSTQEVRGTGCSLAAAAAACLALGYDVIKAVDTAIAYTSDKIRQSIQAGQGARQLKPRQWGEKNQGESRPS